MLGPFMSGLDFRPPLPVTKASHFLSLVGLCWDSIDRVVNGIFEIKIHHGPGYRVYFGIDGEDLILLLLGGDKSSQRMDILKAKSGASMHRSNSYNERFSKEIRNPRYARTYISELLNSQDEGLETIEDVLRLIAKKMGTTEFAEFVGERVQNIDKFIKGDRHPKRETLDKFLRPFGLETVLDVRPMGHRAS